MPVMRMYPGYTKAELQEQGVYAIVHKLTGRQYIGETRSFFGGRWSEHVALLNRNAHFCPPLQRDWNEYGADAFEFRILDKAPRNYNRSDYEWREYLERKRIREAQWVYNTWILPLPSEPGYPNPYTPDNH